MAAMPLPSTVQQWTEQHEARTLAEISALCFLQYFVITGWVKGWVSSL